MVSPGRLVRVCLTLCLGFTLQHVSAAGLHITALNTEVELGKPVWVTLTSEQTAVSLNTIDFSPWQQDFVLPRDYELSIADDNRSQRLRMQLFPLHKGQFELPALSFLKQTSNAMTIDVIEARDTKSRSPIAFACKLPNKTPWQQQQVIVACSITLGNAYAVFTQPTDNVSGVQLLPMQVQQYVVHETLEPQTRYQLGWVLIPARAGKLHVQLPPIQYVRDGVVTHQFYVPPLELAVQALPAWLPGTIPVGRVTVTNYSLSQAWLSTSVLSHLQLQLQLAGMAADVIPAYPQQLRSDSAVQYYSAQQQLFTRIDNGGIQHRLSYTIPLVAKHLGIYQLPALRLQYFDPASGTLKTTEIHGSSVIILNTWLKALLLLFGAGLLIWLARFLLQWLTRYWRRYQTYRSALQQLPQSNSLPAIRQVMQTMAQAEGWPTNLTYLQWQRRMQSVVPMAQQLAVHNLNAASYARQDIAMQPIIQLLTKICRARVFALA